ncbi:glycosyltransferase family 39 protein [Rhodococcus sp. BP-241]|uniref:ArnT family glycosyltransferase n=1 Tax=Rhodococcus sp. BP-241 TaxID=2739441 RepID=UPI0027E041EE|nr:glycosyltransferase family 39 protein [Rhodococcus sp. BP-241]
MNARGPSTALRWFTCVAAAYGLVGAVLSLRFGYLLGDALSRTYAAQAVLHSRDPHVSAIGFVFTPLTALLQLPVVAFSDLLPVITRWNLSGIAVSAVFMAGAVTTVRGICLDRGCGPVQTTALTLVFAVNPMIVFYGANGMSEAVFLFFLCWTARRLLRWISTDDVHDLLVAGIALALAYLTRYDAVAAIAAAAFLVFGVTLWRRGRSHWREMRRQAALDAVLVAGPGLIAFLVWAAISWIITGQAFAQFSSTYGNAAILAQSGGPTGDPIGNAAYVATAVLALGPAIPLLLPTVAGLSWRRRDLEFLVAPALFGAVLAFQALTYIGGSTFGFLRFFIAAIPLALVGCIQVLSARGAVPSRRPGTFAHSRRRAEAPTDRTRFRRIVATGTVILCVGSLPVTTYVLLQPSLSPQQYALGQLLSRQRSDEAQRIIASFSTERGLADNLDAQDLPDGSVLVDSVYGFAIVAASRHPKQFVVPSDEDFTTVLNDPAEAGVRLMLTVPNSGRGESDALNRRYPTIWENGAEVGSLVVEVPNDGADQPVWRIYRVLGVAD